MSLGPASGVVDLRVCDVRCPYHWNEIIPRLFVLNACIVYELQAVSLLPVSIVDSIVDSRPWQESEMA